MHYFPVMLCFAALLIFPVPGDCGLFSRNKTALSEPAMTERVDEKTQAPLGINDNFSPDTGTLYATVKVSDAPKKTEIKALFFMMGDSERQIAEDSLVTWGTGYVSFSLDGPPSGWPVNRYKVQFLLNGKVAEELFFNIAEEKASSPVNQETAKTDDAPGAGVKTFKDTNIGFSFELPHDWQFYVEPSTGNYIFNGPENSPDSEITIVVQILDSRKGGETDLKVEMLNLVNEFQAIKNAAIIKKDQVEVSGTVAPFFLVTYPAEDKREQTVEFGHTQIGLENDPYLFLVSYSAPRQIYQEKVGIFQHMVDSAQLFEPEK